MQVTDAPLTPGTQDPSPLAASARSRLAAFWAAPAGKIMVLATVLALVVRFLTLSQTGYLRGISEYDDGVYLGAAIRLTQGIVPYRDFAFVQPPGILLVMTPVAAVARILTTVKGLVLARILTVLASAACVPLAGSLVRYRGTVVTLVTCGLLAVYPSDIATGHTLLLEPWMNLCCLLAACAAFRRGALASPRRLLWAGLALGFATSIKFWAGLPAAVILALCLLDPERRAAGLRRYLPGAAAGFLLPVLPFLLSAPSAFWHGTIADQAVRAGAAVPVAVRFAYVTGAMDFLDTTGHISLLAGRHSMYNASFAPHVDLAAGVGWLPYAAAALIIGVIAAGCRLLRRQGRLTQLEWLALVTSALASVSVLGYSAFFYHYPDFPAPWLAIILGCAAGGLAPALVRRWPSIRPSLYSAIASLLIAVAVLEAWETFSSHEPEAENMAAHIPVGKCLFTDEVSLAIAADRFTTNPPGCPVIVDSLAETLVRSNGISVYGGADKIPSVVARWRDWLGKADYVWLSPSHYSRRRIPWTPGLSIWFNANFRRDGMYSSGTGQLYKRVTPKG